MLDSDFMFFRIKNVYKFFFALDYFKNTKKTLLRLSLSNLSRSRADE